MADLLLYAAIHSQKQLLFPVSTGTSFTTTGTSDQNTTVLAPYTGLSGGASGHAWRTNLISQWEKDIGPYTAPRTNSYCCGDFTSSYYRCGFTGSFCVPPGVSRVTFQLWGAGSGSAQNCCCGGSPAGINGSYSMFQVDVCPGEVFCMCGGCAFCCCAGQDSVPGGYSGTCGTFINYCGNPNGGSVAGGSSTAYTVCAPGADCMHYCLWNCQVAKAFPGYSASCPMALPSITNDTIASSTATRDSLIGTLRTAGANNCSAASCSGCWSFCVDAGGDDVYVPPVYGCRIPFASSTSSFTAKNAILKGIPTMYPEILITCSHSTGGFTQPAPVYGFTALNGSLTSHNSGSPQLSHAIQTYCGNTCAGHCADATASGRCIPGMGAVGSAAYGGIEATTYPGGQGRTGMICISWECS